MSFSLLVKKLESAKVNEAIIINEILKNSKQIINKKMYLKDIADMVHISHSSVSRLISKHGFCTWNDFVNSCVIEEMFFKSTSDTIIDKMYIQSTFLKKWIRKNSLIVEDVVKHMSESKLSIFFGERISGNIAQYMSFMLGFKDKMTVHYFFENQLLPVLGNSTTLFILTSSTRTNYSELIDFAHKKGTDVIIIDTSPNPIEYNNAKHIKLPLISYVSEKDILTYLKTETLRQFLIHCYDQI